MKFSFFLLFLNTNRRKLNGIFLISYKMVPYYHPIQKYPLCHCGFEVAIRAAVIVQNECISFKIKYVGTFYLFTVLLYSCFITKLDQLHIYSMNRICL